MDLKGRLIGLLGADSLKFSPEDTARYLVDHRRLYQGRALGVALPRSTAEVSRLLAWCNGAGIGVVPQGGNTGYCGGATPDESGSQLVVSLERLNQVRLLDAAADRLVVEAGCTLARVQDAARSVDRLFPLSLGSEGSCQIGGNLATNAGGTAVLRYGMTRELTLGLEVVLADGSVLSNLSGLRKDNTGYDLTGLFVGSEGTLGIVTAACLRLFPLPKETACAWIALPSPDAALTLLARLRAAAGDRVTTLELVPDVALKLVLEHLPTARDPGLATAPWYLLLELTDARASGLGELLENELASAIGEGLLRDAAIAGSDRQRDDFWLLREGVPEAQRRAGGSLKHDVAVPVASIPELIARGGKLVESLAPEGFLVAYGHAGDGNLHFNVNQRPGADAAAFAARADGLKRAVHDLVMSLGGSFSAEHGIGRLKVGELERYASPAEMAAFRAIKQALDPRGILNPGKVLEQKNSGERP
ncbi:MAG: FAD-binding oxidoreductase [Steroidobacteraceae bacterium]